MMLRDIAFKVQAVENIMHGNVEMQLLLHHFMASLCENIIVSIIFDTLRVKSHRLEVNVCRHIAITAGLCLARKVISWVVRLRLHRWPEGNEHIDWHMCGTPDGIAVRLLLQYKDE